MKKYQLTTPVCLIATLDNHVKEHGDEAVTVCLVSDDCLDMFNALGLFDALRAYSKFMDLTLEICYPASTPLVLVVMAALEKEKVKLTKSFFAVFDQPKFFMYGTKTDIRIATDAFGEVLDRCYEIIAASLDQDTDTIKDWATKARLINGENYFRGLGFSYMGDD